MIIRISLDLYGDSFSPKKFIEQNKDSDFIVFSSNETEDFVDSKENKTFDFGSLSIIHPSVYGVEDNINDYQRWYVSFVANSYSIMIDCGVTEIRLFWDVFFSDQCNFEVFDNELLSILSKYNVAIPMSVYKLSSEKIEEMIRDKNRGIGK